VFGIPGPVHTLNLSGPAAGPPGTFTINDIASTPSGDTLLVAPTFLGKLMTINPVTGTSRIVAGVGRAQRPTASCCTAGRCG